MPHNLSLELYGNVKLRKPQSQRIRTTCKVLSTQPVGLSFLQQLLAHQATRLKPLSLGHDENQGPGNIKDLLGQLGNAVTHIIHCLLLIASKYAAPWPRGPWLQQDVNKGPAHLVHAACDLPTQKQSRPGIAPKGDVWWR